MNSRLVFILISIVIPIIAILVGLTNKEIRCFVRLDPDEICQSGYTDVDLIIEDEKHMPLEDVQVRFMTRGAPEVRNTDSNGYSRIRIPSRGDITIALFKKNFKFSKVIIDLANDPDRTRTYQLEEINSQALVSPTPTPTNSQLRTPTPSPSTTIVTPPTISPSSPAIERWKLVGISTKTGEEVYVDTSSISKSDDTVYFIYKIGKDLITATANCNINEWHAKNKNTGEDYGYIGLIFDL